MNATVEEWLAKAEKDFATARRELQVEDDPHFDAVCFHAQQAIEKLMKGLLIHFGVLPTKTHDLAFLSQSLATVYPSWSWPQADLRFLSRGGRSLSLSRGSRGEGRCCGGRRDSLSTEGKAVGSLAGSNSGMKKKFSD